MTRQQGFLEVEAFLFSQIDFLEDAFKRKVHSKDLHTQKNLFIVLHYFTIMTDTRHVLII